MKSAKKKEKSFTLYKIEVTHDISTWIIYRRYSSFYRLYSYLKKRYNCVPKRFPKRKGGMGYHDKRNIKLQNWLNAALSITKLKDNKKFQKFLTENKKETAFSPSVNRHVNQIKKSGYLYRLAKGKWKKRWYALQYGILYKYQSEEDNHPFGSYDFREGAKANEIDLPIMKIDGKEQFIFLVQSHNGTPFYFYTDTKNDLREWIDAFNSTTIPTKRKKTKVFGISLKDILNLDEDGMPIFLSALFKYIMSTSEDGNIIFGEELFASAPDKALKEEIDGGLVEFNFEDPFSVAGLVIQFLNELPDNLIPRDTYDCLLSIFKIQSFESKKYMLTAYANILPLLEKRVLFKTLEFLNAICTKIEKNRIGHIFGRLILRPINETPDDQIINVMNELIDNYTIFKERSKVVLPPRAKSVKYVKGSNESFSRSKSGVSIQSNIEDRTESTSHDSLTISPRIGGSSQKSRDKSRSPRSVKKTFKKGTSKEDQQKLQMEKNKLISELGLVGLDGESKSESSSKIISSSDDLGSGSSDGGDEDLSLLLETFDKKKSN